MHRGYRASVLKDFVGCYFLAFLATSFFFTLSSFVLSRSFYMALTSIRIEIVEDVLCCNGKMAMYKCVRINYHHFCTIAKKPEEERATHKKGIFLGFKSIGFITTCFMRWLSKNIYGKTRMDEKSSTCFLGVSLCFYYFRAFILGSMHILFWDLITLHCTAQHSTHIHIVLLKDHKSTCKLYRKRAAVRCFYCRLWDVVLALEEWSCTYSQYIPVQCQCVPNACTCTYWGFM